MRDEELKIRYVGLSTNAIYSGIHWAVRIKHANDAHTIVKLDTKGIVKFTKPVNIEFTIYKSGKMYDTSNCSYTAKLIEDGLVRAGILSDDTQKHVDTITIKPCQKVKKGQEYTLVKISDCI